MSKYTLSNKAVSDIEGIAIYTIHNWGVNQAKKYKQGLESILTTLSKNPNIGKNYQNETLNIKQFPFKSHTIFYKVREEDILIVRILNQSMDYKIHL